MPRLRRFIPRLFASLCLGLFTAAAVAYYGERVIYSVPSKYTTFDQNEVGWTYLIRNQSIVSTSRSAHIDLAISASLAGSREIRRRFLDTQWIPASSALDPWNGPADRYVTMVEHGWPMRLTWGVFMHGRGLPNPVFMGVARIPDGPLASRLFPCNPLPVGMMVDAMCWGAPWWLTIWAIQRIRLCRRARAGLCPQCRYDLAGIPANVPCPECGNTVPRGVT